MTTKKATTTGTERYAQRFSGALAKEHFRAAGEWTVSSIGIGTYLGEPDAETDGAYEEALEAALLAGCNVIDTAINYRFQRSEKSIGRTLQRLFDRGTVQRDEIVLCTKAGFLTFEDEYPSDPRKYFRAEYFEKGICSARDIVANAHCMTPFYLQNQMEKSLKNLQVDCIDVFFLHNPETQLSEIDRDLFRQRLLETFEFLEGQVNAGKIQIYGTATWNGYRVPRSDRSYLSLKELLEIAEQVGGKQHHFRAVQLPFNLAMPEALLEANQTHLAQEVSFLEAAMANEMIVLASASILQGRLSGHLPRTVVDFFAGFQADAQRSIQFVRSAPGISSALIGMSSIKHVRENMEVAKREPLSWQNLRDLFTISDSD